MNKKYLYITISWVIVFFTFLVEQYYLNNYLSLKKVKDYALSTGNLFNEIDHKIGDLTSAGQLNYLIWSEGHMSDELRLVKAIHPLIQDVLIFSDEFHLLAGTSDKFSIGEITPLLEKSSLLKSGTAGVKKDGYFLCYPAFDLKDRIDGKVVKGYIVAVLTAPPFLPQGAQEFDQRINKGSSFVMNVTKGNLFWNNPGYLSDADVELIRERLRVTDMDEAGYLNLDLSGKHEIFWSYYPPGNIYFGYVRDGKPFYLFIYFYVMVLCTIVSLIIVFTGNFKKSEKYEVYEKIIENNLQTLAEMKKGMESLIQGIPERGQAETILEVEATIAPLDQTIFPQEAVPAFYHKPDKRGSEVLISDFILLDPLDTKWYKPLKRKSIMQDLEKASRLSRAAFTPELLNLMEQISKKEQTGISEENVEEVIPSAPAARSESIQPREISGTYRSIEKDPFAMALERLYSVDDPGEELDIVLENIRISGKADGLAIMFFDRNIGCFTIETSSGLDVNWTRNFYLLSTDSVLTCPVDRNNNILVSDSLLQNSFFRKRIPSEYLNRLGAIKLMTIQNKEIPVRAALFYWRDGSFFQDNRDSVENSLGSIDTPEYSRLFNEILPVLNKIYTLREKENVHPEESYRDIYNILKSFTVLSDNKISIAHVNLSTPFDAHFRDKLMHSCKSIFRNHERYIVNNPNHLIFLLSETNPEIMENIIREIDSNAQFKILKYPELGKNLFAYL